MARRVEIPIYAGGHIRRVEDVKKILYAGCQKAVLNYGRSSNVEMTEEVSKRFRTGKDCIQHLGCCSVHRQAAGIWKHDLLVRLRQ